MRTLEEAQVLALCARETPAFMAKDLAFNQVGRNGTAIDRQEREVPAAAKVVHGTRHKFLAGTTLAMDEDRYRSG